MTMTHRPPIERKEACPQGHGSKEVVHCEPAEETEDIQGEETAETPMRWPPHEVTVEGRQRNRRYQN